MPQPRNLGDLPLRLGLKLGCGIIAGGIVGLAGRGVCTALGWPQNAAAAAAALAALWAGTRLAPRLARRLGLRDPED